MSGSVLGAGTEAFAPPEGAHSSQRALPLTRSYCAPPTPSGFAKPCASLGCLPFPQRPPVSHLQALHKLCSLPTPPTPPHSTHPTPLHSNPSFRSTRCLTFITPHPQSLWLPLLNPYPVGNSLLSVCFAPGPSLPHPCTWDRVCTCRSTANVC